MIDKIFCSDIDAPNMEGLLQLLLHLNRVTYNEQFIYNESKSTGLIRY